jgi:3-oxoacyl-[acyl-carrier-protein] synthase II
MPQQRDVVITGLGVVCPLGVGCEALWKGLETGINCIDWLPELPPRSNLPFRFAARIKDFDAKQFVQPRKTIKVMCEEIQTAYAAAAIAMEQAGLAKGAIDPERLGVVLGSEMLYGELEELLDLYRYCAPDGQFQPQRWPQTAFKDLFPLWMLKYLPNMAACHISIAHDARGPNNSIVEGGVSSLLALIEAAHAIQRGHADVMLAGGSGSLSTFSCIPFRGWNHLSKWQGDPASASRPFDRRRAGVVPGEGSGVLLLEARDHAERRGAAILARLAGFARRFEPPANPWASRRGQAVRQSIQAALADAGLAASDVGHVNAHGDSSIDNDRLEAQAIRDMLGDAPVTAPKSCFGDLGAGSGAVELVASVLALMRGTVPPTQNYEHPDPDCPVNVVHGQSQSIGKPVALALNQSSTGQAAAVVIARD